MQQATGGTTDQAADRALPQPAPSATAQVGFLAVLRVREARTLLLAALVSGLGDQLARVALAVAVLHRTDSVLLSATVFAVSYVPWIVGGPLLAALADRLPARRVLVGSDLVRGALVALMVVPGLPVWALLLLLLLTETAAPPFDAARGTLLPEVLEGDAYVTGAALMSAVHQATLVGGVALAGLVLAVLDPAQALALDAASFGVSAVLLQVGLRARPAAGGGAQVRPVADLVEGVRALLALPTVRRMVVASWLATAIAVLPEGLAIAYAQVHDAPSWATAALLAAEPSGSIVAALLVSRCLGPDRRQALVWPLMVVGNLPLLGFLSAPGMVGAAVLLFGAGFSGAGLLLVSTRVGRTVPAQYRGRVFGLAASGLMAAQGVALLAGGALAVVLPLHLVIALTGAVGVAGLVVMWACDRPTGRHQAGTPLPAADQAPVLVTA